MNFKTILFMTALSNLNTYGAEQPNERGQARHKQEKQLAEIKSEIALGHITELLESIAQGFDVNIIISEEGTLLHYAIRELLNPENIKQKIRNKKRAQGAQMNITAQDIEEQTKINTETLIEIIKILDKNGININAKNSSDKTALDVANMYKINPIIEFLKEIGALTQEQLLKAWKPRPSPKNLPQPSVNKGQQVNAQKPTVQARRKFEFANQSDNFATVWIPNTPNSWQPKKLFPYEDSGTLHPINGDIIYIYTKAGNFVIEIAQNGYFSLYQDVPMPEPEIEGERLVINIRSFTYPANQQDIIFIINQQGEVDFVSRRPA